MFKQKRGKHSATCGKTTVYFSPRGNDIRGVCQAGLWFAEDLRQPVTVSAEAFDLANLARCVRARRQELDLSHEDVADRGGPSTTKMSQIENEHPTPPRRDVVKKLERALDWQAGSVREILLGGSPTPLKPLASAGYEDLRVRIIAADLPEDVKDHMLATLARATPPPSAGEVRGHERPAAM